MVKKTFKPTKPAIVFILLAMVLMPIVYVGLIGKILYIVFLIFVVMVIGLCVTRSESCDRISKKMDDECHEIKLYYKKRFHKHYISNTKYYEKLMAWMKDINSTKG